MIVPWKAREYILYLPIIKSLTLCIDGNRKILEI